MKKILITFIALVAIVSVYWYSSRSADPESEAQTQTTTTTTQLLSAPTDSSTTSTTQTSDNQSSTGQTREFTVDGDNFVFEPKEIRVKRGDKVVINFRNTGGFHDLVIDEFNVRTAQIQSGSSETIEFIADKSGSFEYYCSVGSHRQMGMRGTLIVE